MKAFLSTLVLLLSTNAFAGFQSGDEIRIPMYGAACIVKTVSADGSMVVRVPSFGNATLNIGPQAASICTLVKKGSIKEYRIQKRFAPRETIQTGDASALMPVSEAGGLQ